MLAFPALLANQANTSLARGNGTLAVSFVIVACSLPDAYGMAAEKLLATGMNRKQANEVYELSIKKTFGTQKLSGLRAPDESDKSGASCPNMISLAHHKGISLQECMTAL
jgi:hypothetical protein